MAILTNDQIGRLAELIAAKDLSRPVKGRYRRPLFRATALGEKYPVVDFIVDALDCGDESLGFFFVQIKGTSEKAPTKGRLPVDVHLDRFNRLVRLPAPTFIIGVDVLAESSYIVAAHKSRKRKVSSITTSFSLSDDFVRIALYKEVLFFWKSNKPLLHQTQFKDDDQ